jgi:hypothetical protein
VLVIRPGSYKPIKLTAEELKQAMRILYAQGPLPGAPKGGRLRLILTSADPSQMLKAAGYLDFCERLTGQRADCWDELNASGGLDGEGATFVALRFALGEALEEAASAVRSMTPTQVRAMLSLMFLGMIVELLSPDPVTKALFILTATNLIAFVGVDFFNHVVKGFTAMVEELARARDFAGIRAAGIRYGERIGPTLARIVVMVATYGVAKFAGLFKGSVLDLPGGSRSAALAESQGFRLPTAEGAGSVALAADGAVVIGLGAAAGLRYTVSATSTSEGGQLPSRPYPSGDGTAPPEPGWIWKGTDPPGGERGAWVNPKNPRESLHPDLSHGPPEGPHWDWNTPDGGRYRLHPDGTVVAK